jgi:hypothetical protein
MTKTEYMRIEDHRDQPKPVSFTRGENIPVGTFFTGLLYTKSLYVRTHNGITNLRDPDETWSFGLTDRGPHVVHYQPVSGFIRIERNA